jgi:hypothetical protein
MIYALLIQSSRPKGTPPAPVDEDILPRHRAMQAEATARGELHAVARLDEPTAARTVRRRGRGFAVSDGPYMETKEWLVGFYLVECEDEAAAIERAKQICEEGGSVEIRPVTWERVPAR